jgi:flagellum-specific ATP synthase
MMLRLNVEKLCQEIAAFDGIRNVGKLRSAVGLLTAKVPLAVGELCHVNDRQQRPVLAEVVGFDNGFAQLMPFRNTVGLYEGSPVVGLGRRFRVPTGERLLGRVIDGLGEPIDGKGPLGNHLWRSICDHTPSPLDRPAIKKPFITGQRAIDGLLTCGCGQRVGLFSGSGVGKSTLLGEIAKGSQCDFNVIVLIGERGREVRPFIDDCLGPIGLARSVVVVSTSDQPALTRIRAAQLAVTIADDFRQQGAHVLFLLDSLTRMAMAQREIGLLQGEPPSARGYTPSVFQQLSTTLEQLGQTNEGTITGILTVLVDGDELEEPVSDAVRSMVDGHVVLDRKLAEKGHYPAIDVGRSLSRVFYDVTDAAHHRESSSLRAILATHEEVADLIRVGAYVTGSSAQIDKAIGLMPAVGLFLRQQIGQYSTFDQTRQAMDRIAAAWPN